MHIQFTVFVFFFNFFFQRLFIFGTERDRAWTGEGQRERETQNRNQAPGSEQSAQSLTWGWNPRTARSWPEPKSDAQSAEPPRRPRGAFLKSFVQETLVGGLLKIHSTFLFFFWKITSTAPLGFLVGMILFELREWASASHKDPHIEAGQSLPPWERDWFRVRKKR